MKTIWKIIIIVIMVGMILSVVGFVTGASRTLYIDRTGVKVSDGSISHITEMNLEQFRSVSVDVGFSDIEFVISDNFGIDLYGNDMEWLWSLEDGTLNITHNRSALLHIIKLDFIATGRNHAKIFLPANTELETVIVRTNSGDIKIGSFRADKADVTSSFGNVELNNITSNHLQVDLSSGRFTGINLTTGKLDFTGRFGNGYFQSVTADSLSAYSNSGDLHFTDCSFGEIDVTNSFGNIITNGFASSKTNILASSGDVRIAGDLSGETVIHANFGDTKLELSREKEEYSYYVSVRFGNIIFDGERQREQSTINSRTILENHLEITSSSGDVEVSFGNYTPSLLRLNCSISVKLFFGTCPFRGMIFW